MDSDKRSNFYMILPSNGSADTRPNNNSSNYIIDWDRVIELKGDWEVALTEYSFHYLPNVSTKPLSITYGGITKASYKCIFFPVDEIFTVMPVDIEETFFKVSLVQSNKLNKYKYELKINSKHAFEAAIYREHNKSKYKDRFNEISSFEADDNHSTEIKLDPAFTYHFESTIDQDVMGKKTLTFDNFPYFCTATNLTTYLSKHCSSIFSIVDSDQNGFLFFAIKPKISYVEFDVALAKILGVNGSGYDKPGKIYTADRKIQLKQSYEQIMIYVSVCDPILVGGAMVPLLRNIWIDTKYRESDVINETIELPMYVPISANSINNIQVNLRYDSGQLINFNNKSKSSLTLHFRHV